MQTPSLARFALATAFALPLALSACSPAAEEPVVGGEASELDRFWFNLGTHCGKAYAGALESEDARDAEMADAAMVMHVRDCDKARIAIPFHIEDAASPGGWNRSRTWVLTRTDDGAIRLRHEHRHEDGSLDAVTDYGGLTGIDRSAPPDNDNGVDFPIDAATIALFEREGLDASLTNVWRVEVDPAAAEDARFTYQLTRRNDPTRLFRATFDASEPVALPPPAWAP